MEIKIDSISYKYFEIVKKTIAKLETETNLKFILKIDSYGINIFSVNNKIMGKDQLEIILKKLKDLILLQERKNL